MESKKIEDELKEKLALTKDLKFILNSPKKILEIIKTELNELAEKYGDERRTKVVSGVIEEFKQEDLIVEENCLIALTEDGYIKRLPPDTFKTQDRGGKGVIGLTTKEDDIVDNLLTASTHSNLLLFTTLGKVFQLKAYDVPATTRTAKGQSLVNFLQIKTEEKVSAMIGLEKLAPEQKYFIMTTQKGIIKKVNLTDFAQVRHSGLLAIKLNDDDRLEWVKPSNGEDDIVIVTSLGQSIRFSEKDVRAMGRAAAGVRAIKLKKNDFVVSMGVMRKDNKKAELLVITENGLGKRTSLNQYKRQHRGGSGIKTAKVTAKTGAVVSGILIDNGADDKESNLDLLIISMSGQVIRLPLKSVSLLGRDTQGVRLMRFRKENDKIASLTLI